jgi:hypothetical protein
MAASVARAPNVAQSGPEARVAVCNLRPERENAFPTVVPPEGFLLLTSIHDA